MSLRPEKQAEVLLWPKSNQKAVISYCRFVCSGTEIFVSYVNLGIDYIQLLSKHLEFWTSQWELLETFGSQRSCSALMLLDTPASSISCASEQRSQRYKLKDEVKLKVCGCSCQICPSKIDFSAEFIFHFK